MISIGKY